MSINSPLPPYSIAIYKDERRPYRELLAVKRIGGHWDVIGADYWFFGDDELFEEWGKVEIVGLGIWPKQTGFDERT